MPHDFWADLKASIEREQEETPPIFTRVNLKVPYAEKDMVKSLGARWDPQAKQWHTTRSQIHLFQRWII